MSVSEPSEEAQMHSLPMPLISQAVFDHVAMAAPRIADMLPLYVDTLGGRIVYVGGDDIDYGFRVVHVGFGDGTKIELMEPTEGSTFLDSFFRRTTSGGLHHVTFLVPDLDSAATVCVNAGCEVFGVRKGTDWHEFFIRPKDACGVLVQIAKDMTKQPPTAG